ncbi:hypothetical protein [Pontibacillus halophilus]|uniref:hypothetical protein n=1 Tax=Pontibacillus halophilus TaxID=516704 RepID=UPI000404FA0D|nr:hypothetical protein [Pontibacillus halophilus]
MNNVVKVDFNNKKSVKENDIERSCSNCVLYDLFTNRCSVFDGIDTSIPETALRCNSYLADEGLQGNNDYWNEASDDLTEDEGDDYEFTIVEDEFTATVDSDYFFSIQGQKHIKNSKYPQQPDIPTTREDALWYVSPNNEFGAWIINTNPKRFVDTNELSLVAASERTYSSPYPLHNHKASEGLRNFMCWYVNEQGVGQYTLLINGNISFITDPFK